jgi:glycosyltransferase involved in cell wall biosynthesis
MNYFLFTTDLRRAGAQHVVSILAERWSRDAAVTIILLRNEVEFDLPATVRVVALDLATGPVPFYSGMMIWQAKRRLRAILAENEGPFAFYSFLESPNFISVLLKREFPDGIFIGGLRVNVLMYSRIFHLLYPQYGHLDALISLSQWNRRLFIEKFGVAENKVFFIPNPIDFTAIQRQSAAKIPAQLAAFVGKKPIILAAGRMVKVKNHALLLRAFARMPVDDNPPHLVILGDGPERRALLRLAQRLGITARLTMPGKVANPFVWMAHSDLFVHSANYEGWGNVIIEAMVTGLPIVACDAPTGPSEILQNGAWGMLVPTHDADALSAAMATQLRCGEKEYPFLREWNADAIARRYRMVAEDILQRREKENGLT